MKSYVASLIKPRLVRSLIVGVGLLMLSVIWGGNAYLYHTLAQNFEERLEDQLNTETLFLDDHIERSLDSVTNKLEAAVVQSQTITSLKFDSATLRKLIESDLIIRSISLINDRREVIASSNPLNVGQIVPQNLIGQSRLQVHGTEAQLNIGPIFNARDIAEATRNNPSPIQRAILASLSFEHQGLNFEWIATINVSYFENFWKRIGHSESIEILLLNSQGKLILNFHPKAPNQQILMERLLREAERDPIGMFYFGADDRFLVSYRFTGKRPKIFAQIADHRALNEPVRMQQIQLSRLAIVLTIILFAIIAIIYRGYLRYEQAAIYAQNLFTAVTSHVMMSQSTTDGRIIDVNAPFLKVTGYQRKDIIGKNHRILNSGAQTKDFYTNLWQTISHGNIWSGTFKNRTFNDKLIWVNSTIIPFKDQWGKVYRYVALYSDITDAIETSIKFEQERKLRESLESLNHTLQTTANTDALTGTLNRRGLDAFIESARKEDALAQTPVSVLVLDVDHFKNINDTWGHAAGDEVLRSLTDRWTNQIRASDVLVRLGGEEFAVVLLRSDAQQARQVANKILDITRSAPIRYEIEGVPVDLSVTISIGLAGERTLRDTDIQVLINNADRALYRAKSSGRNRVEVDPWQSLDQKRKA